MPITEAEQQRREQINERTVLILAGFTPEQAKRLIFCRRYFERQRIERLGR